MFSVEANGGNWLFLRTVKKKTLQAMMSICDTQMNVF